MLDKNLRMSGYCNEWGQQLDEIQEITFQEFESLNAYYEYGKMKAL